jgi:hypothetical protein
MPKRHMTPEERRAANAKPVRRALKAIGPHRLTLEPSNMAAGPCEACLEVAKREWSAAGAPMPPFDGCSWPDQCACQWRIAPFSWG